MLHCSATWPILAMFCETIELIFPDCRSKIPCFPPVCVYNYGFRSNGGERARSSRQIWFSEKIRLDSYSLIVGGIHQPPGRERGEVRTLEPHCNSSGTIQRMFSVSVSCYAFLMPQGPGCRLARLERQTGLLGRLTECQISFRMFSWLELIRRRKSVRIPFLTPRVCHYQIPGGVFVACVPPSPPSVCGTGRP